MAGLEGTIKTPMGPVQKKTALILGGGVAVIGVIVWYRQRNAAADTPVATDGEINPATGYVYGSPEDAAALAAQAGYVSPPANPSGGSGSIPPSNLGYATNGQWVQSVIQYMIDNDLVQDSSQLSSALGKYITGAYCSDTDVSLVQQAIAVQGFPPLAGPTGYPPSINRNAPSTPPPTTTPVDTSMGRKIASFQLGKITKNSIAVNWSVIGKPTNTKLKINANVVDLPASQHSFEFRNLKPGNQYNITVSILSGSVVNDSKYLSVKTPTK